MEQSIAALISMMEENATRRYRDYVMRFMIEQFGDETKAEFEERKDEEE